MVFLIAPECSAAQSTGAIDWAQPGMGDSAWADEGGHVGERTGVGLVDLAVLEALDAFEARPDHGC